LAALIAVGLMGGGIVLAAAAGALPLILGRQALTTALNSSEARSHEVGWAAQRLSFGGEGIGPGLFQDARHIGVDDRGQVYVGEYQGGRIQVFDSTGSFQTQWFVDRRLPLTGMAVARDGSVYTVQAGLIVQRDGASGEAIRTLTYPDGDYFEDVSLAADGGLVATWYANRDDLVIFDARGMPVRTIEAALSGLTGDSELSLRVAVDGQDNIFVLGQFHEAVFRFDADGRYVNRFGSEGDEPGQFTAPGPIAVDGQGRVFIGDFAGVQVFDGTGRYLNVVPVEGYPYGVAFDGQGDLWVAAGTRVFEFAIPGA
jgi:DNA-binding beta-propeller fold protein YncE